MSAWDKKRKYHVLDDDGPEPDEDATGPAPRDPIDQLIDKITDARNGNTAALADLERWQHMNQTMNGITSALTRRGHR